MTQVTVAEFVPSTFETNIVLTLNALLLLAEFCNIEVFVFVPNAHPPSLL